MACDLGHPIMSQGEERMGGENGGREGGGKRRRGERRRRRERKMEEDKRNETLKNKKAEGIAASQRTRNLSILKCLPRVQRRKGDKEHHRSPLTGSLHLPPFRILKALLGGQREGEGGGNGRKEHN